MALRDILASEGLSAPLADETAMRKRLAAARTYVEALEAKVGRTAAGFNVASPFARKLEDLIGPLMGPGSRISVSMGRGEFSSKMGMQIRVIDPNDAIFTSPADEGDQWDEKTEEFQIVVQDAENSLSAYFGLPVHTEGTEEAVIAFTVELRVQA